MSRGKMSPFLLTLALAVAVLPLLGTTPAAAAPDQRIAKKTATLTTSVAGFPTSSEAGRQIRRADVQVHYADSGTVALEVDVALKGAPQRNPDADLRANVGKLSGNHCTPYEAESATRRTYANDGSEFWLWNSNLPQNTTWDCVIVMVHGGDLNNPYDVMVGRLTNQYVQPKLAISKPILIDKTRNQLKLIRGVAQPHQFVVRNTGGYRARNVVLVVNGKGIKKVRRKVGTLAPGERKTVTVPMRLTSGKRTKARFVVRGSGVKATRTVKVRAVKAPARPAAGKWRDKSNTFTFTVKNGRITKFRGIRLRMACRGGITDYTTYQYVNLTFPTVKVPRHGYVNASKNYRQGTSWYAAGLQGRVVGKKLTQAKFTYFTAGNCSVIEGFTARRR